MLSEHKRVKHGETPGQINRGYMIGLREFRRPQAPDGFCLEVFPWQHLDERDAASVKRAMKARTRLTQAKRDRRAVNAGLADAEAS